jgi:hypothetical protein
MKREYEPEEGSKMSAQKVMRLLQTGDVIECLTCEAINVFYSGYVDEAIGIYLGERKGNGFRCGNCQAEVVEPKQHTTFNCN